jgi:germination protein, Ger(x)C family
MKSIKCILSILIILLNSLLLNGCWNYKDIEKYSIVTGFALDRSVDKNKYLLTVEIVDFEMSGKEAKATSKLIEAEGYTLFDAMRNMINITGKRLNWSHARIAVICQDIAKEGINNVLDMIFRDAEMREELLPVISTEKTAREILSQIALTSQMSSEEIYQMLRNQTSLGKAPAVKAYELIEVIQEEGISPALPAAGLVQVKEKSTAKVGGAALFKQDKLVGFLDEEETKHYLFAVDKFKKGLLVESEDDQGKKYNITLEVFDNKTKIKPEYSNGKLIINLNIKTDAAIAETETSKDYISKEGREKLKDDAQKSLKNSVETVIKKVQISYGTDVFGFGKNVKANLPSVWRSVGDNWTDMFKNLDVNVSVDINLRNSALLSRPIEKEE